MKPGRILGATRAVGAPKNWNAEKNGECDTLEIRDSDGYDGIGLMESAWYPSPQELAEIMNGQPIRLTIWGRSHPPVSVNVEQADPEYQVAPSSPLQRLEALGRRGLVVSICYGPGPAPQGGVGYSVDCLHVASGDSFARPFAANSFIACVEIVEFEAKRRRWIE